MEKYYKSKEDERYYDLKELKQIFLVRNLEKYRKDFNLNINLLPKYIKKELLNYVIDKGYECSLRIKNEFIFFLLNQDKPWPDSRIRRSL